MYNISKLNPVYKVTLGEWMMGNIVFTFCIIVYITVNGISNISYLVIKKFYREAILFFPYLHIVRNII